MDRRRVGNPNRNVVLTATVKSPVCSRLRLSPSASVTVSSDEKSIDDTDVVPAAFVRRSKFSPLPATWSS